ncbi:MAG: ATP-binding protein, partial [Thermomicrobiales bacterium]
MTTTLDKPIVCPVLVGREEQVEALESALARTRDGAGQVLLLPGEAGIGKSRLIAVARARAATEGCLVLLGSCFEPDRTVPYAPVLDLLRAFLAGKPAAEIADLLGPAAPELMRLLPELAECVSPRERGPALDPAQEKLRLFHALCQFVDRLADACPVLFVVEDLHWADETSLEWLLLLARRLASRPILLLFSYREEETTPGLGHLVAELDRARLAAVLRPTPLTADEVAEMVRASLDLHRHGIFVEHRLLRANVVRTIHDLTEGNPFFIEEVLRSLVVAGGVQWSQGGWDWRAAAESPPLLPHTVEEAVQRRAAGLTAAVRRTLTLAAIIGRRFDFALLQDVTGRDEATLLRELKELALAGLIVEESPDLFAFRHALTRAAITAGLLERERQVLHREVAAALERRVAGKVVPPLDDLATHCFMAGDWQKALVYARQAGDRAHAMYAPRAAVEHLTRAMVAASRLGMAPDPALLTKRGRAFEMLGEFDRARDDHEAALHLAHDAEDHRAEWQALLDLGALWAGRDYDQTGAFFQRAVDLAGQLGEPLVRGHSLNRLGNWLTNVGRPDEALEAHHEALALLEAEGDERGTAETLDLLGMAYGLALGDAVAAADHFARAAERFRALDDTRGLVSSLISFIVYACPGTHETFQSSLVQREECIQTLSEALRLAQAIEWPAGEAYAHFTACRALAAYGDFGLALRHGEQALRIATEIDHQQWEVAARLCLGLAYLAMLAPDAAVAQLEAGLALARPLGSAWWGAWGTALLAIAHLQKGLPTDAEAVLAPVLPPGLRPRHAGERWLVWVWGELALALGRPDEALRLADELIASTPGVRRDQPIPALLHLKGKAFLARRRLDEAVEALEAAKQGAAERGQNPLRWQTHCSLARLRRLRKEPAVAQREAAAAHDLFGRLAGTLDA